MVLSGKVVDPVNNGKGIAGVEVSLAGGMPTFTNSDGYFEMDIKACKQCVPARILIFELYHAQYGRCFPNAIIGEEYRLLQPLELKKEVPITIYGRVKDAISNDWLSGILVSCDFCGSSTITDPFGQFKFYLLSKEIGHSDKVDLLFKDTTGNYKDTSFTKIISIQKLVKDEFILRKKQSDMSQIIKEIKENIVSLKNRTIMIGCPDSLPSKECDKYDYPEVEVEIDAFSISRLEVTNEQYCTFLNDKKPNDPTLNEWIYLDCKGDKGEKGRIRRNNSVFEVSDADRSFPVVCVTWDGAEAYCNWLGEKTNQKWRLPTEAEWEYAAKYISKEKSTLYAGTSDEHQLSNFANFWRENQQNGLQPVRNLKPNNLGLYDMSGSVLEWCTYSSEYERQPKEAGKEAQVLRGGAWNLPLHSCRVYKRRFGIKSDSNTSIGFRVVLSKN